LLILWIKGRLKIAMKILFHVLVGSESPTRACFPFLQAINHKERGDEVSIALAGDAVVLIRDAVIDSVVPVGWPPLKDTFEKVVQCGIPIYV
jgi:predicted peroxiredoxin